jgi:CheY-like chemotaxis protein
LIYHAVEICRDDLSARQLTFTADLAAPRHHVNADAVRLEQVFWNLLKNAIKFTPEGGAVTVRSFNDPDGSLCVQISDTGVGIEPEALPRVFDAFGPDRAHPDARRGGLGLGLAISRSLVELHGGHISAASEGHGRGATFTIVLASVAEPVAADRPRGTPRRPGDSRRILLVEDDAVTAVVLARLLRGAGHQVVAAGTVQTALATGMSQPFDLLLSDIGLPDGSGLEIMRQLRSQRGMKGIAFSGYGMDGDVRSSEAAGFAQHIVKPVDIGVLLDAIEQVCASAQAAV